MEIAGKVAIVTAIETGRVLAIRLGAEGAAVVVADVDPVGGAETVAKSRPWEAARPWSAPMFAWTQT